MAAATLDQSDNKFVEAFLGDLRNISNEARKKHTAVKEAAETAIIRLRNLSQNGKDVRERIVNHCLDLLQPILLSAESGNPKLVILALEALQRLFAFETIADASLPVVMSLLWTLMENHTEELKLIQTITRILTSSNVLHAEYLAKCLVICLRMHFSKDPIVSNTAGAAIRQLVPLLFEKALDESKLSSQSNGSSGDSLRIPSDSVSIKSVASTTSTRSVPASLYICGSDAYSLLQDLCQVMNGDQPTWLVGMTEMTRVLALELIESVLLSYRPLFDLKEFSFLLKERLCPLLFKLISPCVRHARSVASTPGSTPSTSMASIAEKPSFPVTVHLVRITYVLLTCYCDILRTESEIFYSLLIKFIDADKVHWTKLLALEVFYKLLADPRMVILISQTYSTKAASEGVFCDMINTLNNYILTVFVKPTSAVSSPTTPPSTPQSVSASAVQATFTYKDVNVQIIPIGKPVLLDSRDADPPPSTDNYGMSLAFSAICFVSRTVQDIMDKTKGSKENRGMKAALHTLVQNSWCGVLSSVSTLLEASNDESVTDSLLHICKVYIQAAGLVNIELVREAFITALCKAAFPINYTINILKAASSRLAPFRADTSGIDRRSKAEGVADAKNRNQIVAVGTPLSSSFPGAVMLTAKNITCLNTLLEITILLGDFLDGSWILVLASLQHLAWILGINQFIPGMSNGLSKHKQRPTESTMNTIVTTVLMSDLPELTKKFDEVFKNTKQLSDGSLDHVVQALCKLSLDAIETAAHSREPSLFAIAKLVDVSLVNMFRIEAWWAPVTSNLAEVSANSNQVLREWSTDALTILVKEGLTYDFQPPLSLNMALQEKLIRPLLDLSKVVWSDVRLKQYNCLNHVILSSSEKISNCWRPIVEVIGAVNGVGDEALVRASFKCVQAVVSDHLRNISFDCIEQCADAAAKFGTQTVDLNVSLTAIGVLWNIADYIYQNRTGFNIGQERLLNFMLNLYKQLSQLCLDVRPEVRKSAAQTLFLAIASHGAGLDLSSWQRLIVDACYTLLKCLENYYLTASETKLDDKDDKVIIHHSRDTAKKQWAETWAMVLPSVTKTVLLNLPVVLRLKQPQQVWQGLLFHIQRAGMPGMEEVAMASFRCIDEILSVGEIRAESAQPDSSLPKTTATENLISIPMWEDVWKTYHAIGMEMIGQMKRTTNTDLLPSQKLLTFYTGLFRRLCARLTVALTVDMLRKLQDIYPQIMLPVLHKNASKVLPCKAEITPLQECVMQNAECLQMEIVKAKSPTPHLIAELFNLWLKYTRFSSSVPVIARALSMEPDYLVRWWAATFSLFSETAMHKTVELYQETFTWKLVIESEILGTIIQALQQPLRLHETDAHQTAWRVAMQSIVKVVRMTLPTVTAQTKDSYKNMWAQLVKALDSFLYGPKAMAQTSWGMDEIDLEVVTFVRVDILPYVALIPADDLKNLLSILHKGSLHRDVTENNFAIPVNAENYASLCFEALLDFQLIHFPNAKGIEGINVPAVLLRCEKLLASLSLKSSEQAVLKGKNALRCIRSVLSIIKQTPVANGKKCAVAGGGGAVSAAYGWVDRQVWHDAISLYPKLVSLVPVIVMDPQQQQSGGQEVQRFDNLLSAALLQYAELIQPPFKL